MFNALTESFLIQEAKKKHQQPPKQNFRKEIYSNFMNVSNDKTKGKKGLDETEKQNELTWSYMLQTWMKIN